MPTKSICTELHENKNNRNIFLIQNRQTYCIPKYMFSGHGNSNPRSDFKSKHSDRLTSSFLALGVGHIQNVPPKKSSYNNLSNFLDRLWIFFSCYNIQIDLSFSLAPNILSPFHNLEYLKIDSNIFSIFVCLKKLTPL